VDIYHEHIPIEKLEKRQSQHQFDTICFGSKVRHDVYDCTPYFLNSKEALSGIGLKVDFLRIALFDIWMANDDRTPNNPNLLISLDSGKQKRFVAIDHAATFNTGFLERPLYELSWEDSILYAPLFAAIFQNTNKDLQVVEYTLQAFYRYVQICENELPSILNSIPVDWLSNPHLYLSRCKSALFSGNWLKTVENTFRTFVSQV